MADQTCRGANLTYNSGRGVEVDPKLQRIVEGNAVLTIGTMVLLWQYAAIERSSPMMVDIVATQLT